MTETADPVADAALPGPSAPTGRPWVRWLLVALAVLVVGAVVAAGAFIVWGSTPQEATPVALAALSSGDGITVGQTPAGWTFRPTAAAPAVGFVLYPGGHVDPRAYAPLAREIARRGYLVVVPQVPLSLAFFDIDAAGRAISENPTVKTWAVGGHSLGGTASTIYVANHPGTISGLVLLASYPPDGTNLSQAKGPSGAPLAALSVRGSNDGLVTPAKIEHAKPLLPASTIYVTIPGGNHAQFGDYGIQSGDGTPEITADTQVTKTAGLVSLFLGSLK